VYTSYALSLFFQWKGIYPGEQMSLALFLEKSSFDRAEGRFADYLFASKYAKADVLLTTVLGPLRRGGAVTSPRSAPARGGRSGRNGARAGG